MTDRELLEQAAKAACIELYGWDGDKAYIREPFAVGEEEWNPLTDDGDALRLAVKLQIIVRIWDGGRTYVYDDVFGYEFVEDHNDDPYAATRRAIVRAAAEIGKDMK